MADFKDVMSRKGESEDYSDSDEYDAHVKALGSALGLDDAAARSAAEAICGLARYEIDHEGSEEKSEGEGMKKPSLMMILAGKKGR